MALPVKDQFRYWGIAMAAFLVILWFLGDVILPFVLGGAIAYFLDPVADRIERMGASRALATTIITLSALLIFVLMALLVIPLLVQQAISLFETAPQLFENLQGFLTSRFPSLVEEDSVLRQSLISIGETIRERGGELLNTVLTSVNSLVGIVLLFVIVPVVAFYLLYDWDNMVAKVDDLLPRDHAPTIRHLAAEIDKTLASFIRGMGTVSLILGTYYAVALMLVGLQFGLVVGALAGLVTFIPYVGALVGGALAIGLALFQFWGDWVSIGLVAGIFVLGQIVEGNVLTPKLVGSSVGLHPVWLIFALSVFGSLFGFVGMLVAVPVAAVIGVVARFGIGGYKKSLLYRGVDTRKDI
ncbi:MAG: AI-2E family transporter [Paracoccaceae bacterium]|jgi:predicted PurR-regulated permease PerM|uniref:AI-2E family transporter n=1 Tax=unclassified Seohaeicola TaxID=2641111 RepID=UPI00237BEC5D|nr:MULTISPECIES: AI-2E family transporter [unclassified Seohaeicola]MDD9708121.1 AI-2E family transporter [Seohaeicola sp. 4SK31]MDD9736085.1 AI-2E family transporter [Seohaeicola sp. SP36]MDF1707446.1 AI-2E family transporter [Paracoccaceae bacterium]